MPPIPSFSSKSEGETLPDPHARWFVDEVHTHDTSLKAYLRGAFPSVRDVDDVVQESYLRIWKAKARRPIVSARSFLFRIARNVALDGLRRNYISPIALVSDLEALQVADEKSDLGATLALREKAALLSDCLATLSPRSREVIILCKLQGLSHQDAGQRLGISDRTVDEHMLRGLKRLSEELRRRGCENLFDA